MRFPLTELDGQLTASRGKELLSSRELLYEHRTCVRLSSTEVAAQTLSVGLQFPKQRHPAALEALSLNSEGITLLLLA